MEDKHLHDSECKRLFLKSLLRTALEIATSLHSNATSTDLLELLKNHYGEVLDGFEMYTQFRSSIQEGKETATEYLQRLHLLALKTAQRGGMKKTSDPKRSGLAVWECLCPWRPTSASRCTDPLWWGGSTCSRWVVVASVHWGVKVKGKETLSEGKEC